MNTLKLKRKKIIKIFSAIILSLFSFQALAGNGLCAEIEQINLQYFDESTGMIWHPTKKHWLVWEKKGNIHLLNSKSGNSSQVGELKTKLDTRGDGGLIAMAIHPKYPATPYIYITRTVFAENNRSLVLEKYVLDGYDIKYQSKRELLKVSMLGTQNTGGHIAFDSFNNLFLSLGDSRDQEDNTPASSVNSQTMLGSLLRLDVSTYDDKAVAAVNNPFTELLDGAKEVYAFGFKNPARFSIDSLTNELWLSDSGRQIAGEINFILPKHFYGWNCLDGRALRISKDNECVAASIFQKGEPVFEYSHKHGVQSIGGYVYRGKKNNAWYGRYFFADYGSGKIWSAIPSKNNRFNRVTLAYSGHIIPISFAVDGNKELYLIDYQGKIFSLQSRSCKTPQNPLRR